MRLRFRAITPAGLALCVALPLRAQATGAISCSDSTAVAPDSACTRSGIRATSAALPVDRIADLLALEPGVAALDRGELSVRAAGADALATYIDGVPVTPGHRLGGGASFGGSWFGTRGSGIAIGTNGFQEISLAAGVTSAEYGGGRGGTLGIATRLPTEASVA
jgi:hypothetical protein